MTELHQSETRCHTLLEETVKALNDDVVVLMLLAVQRGYLEICIRLAIKR